MTAEKLRKLIRLGFGQGRFQQYQPWLRVRRSFSSPVSKQHVFQIPGQGRHAHLLSGLEHSFALLAGYLGAIEVREQVPVHPEPARHPGFDSQGRYPIRGSDAILPGLHDIAKDAGIDPGRYPGTALTFVMTTDLVLLVKDGVQHKLVYWPVKPSADLWGPGGVRRRERLELERRHAALSGAAFELMTDETVSSEFLFNLRAHKPFSEDLERLKTTETLQRFAERFNDSRGGKLGEVWRAAGAFAGIHALDEQRRLFDVAVWLGLLDVHLSKPLGPHLPIWWGGWEQRSKRPAIPS
ncbi:MAG: TnsA endonuclease N-terminal domain-containing protein [Pelomonas sp.]|nr:TnsA endonuclease N-terminal domain-containing protein [Roseateles sp.]